MSDTNTLDASVKQYTYLDSRGGLGPGFIFSLFTMGVLVGGALMMIGNIFPGENGAPLTNQTVIIITPTGLPALRNLQLHTFPADTLTPTPSPTVSITPTSYPAPTYAWVTPVYSGSNKNQPPP